jgi:glucan 1,3-beta-glucosidase
VSNHPDWQFKAGLGIGAAFLVFLAYWMGSGGVRAERSWTRDAGAAAIAFGAGLLFGLAAVNLPLEGETPEDRLRAAGMLVLALAVPLAASFALARGIGLAGFASALDPSRWRQSGSIPVVLAALFAATVVAAIHVALGLVFDPRYKDFPFAALAGPVIALAVLTFADRKLASAPGAAEVVAAALLASSALFVVVNEGLANWQALIFAGLLLLLALTCLKAEAAPG